MDFTSGLTDYTSASDYDSGYVSSTYDATNLNTAVGVRLSGEVPGDLSTAVLANLSSVLTTLATPTTTEATASTLEVITGMLATTEAELMPPNTPRYPKGCLGFTAASAFIISILGSFGESKPSPHSLSSSVSYLPLTLPLSVSFPPASGNTLPLPPGNLLTIIALPMSKKLRTTATAFVVNLAVVELLFCVFILPMSGAQYLYLQQHEVSLLTDRDCMFFTVVRYTLTQVELQTILAIALTR